MLSAVLLNAQLSFTPPRAVRTPPPTEGAEADPQARGADGAPTERMPGVPVVPVAAEEAGAWRRLLRADATVGWNSNARQIASDDARNVFPNAALVGALQFQGMMQYTPRTGGAFRLDGSALAIQNVALDAAVPANEGSGSMRAQYSVLSSGRSELVVAGGASLGTLAARRATDPRMAALDPTSANRTYAGASGEAAWLCAISARTRVGVGGTATGLFTVTDDDVSLGEGRTLRHRGLDLATYAAEAGLEHDLTARVQGELLMRHVHTVQPFALDLSTGTPRNVGPIRADTATLLAGLGYEASEHVQGDVRAGVSVATAPPGDPDGTPIVVPAGTVRGAYDDTRRRVALAVSYQYDAAVPRLGAGPTLRAMALGYGVPVDHGSWRSLHALTMATAERSVTRTTLASSLEMRSLAATGALRYALGYAWGIVAGVDVRAARFTGSGLVPAPFSRTLVFVGVSWFDTNGRDERSLVPFGEMPF